MLRKRLIALVLAGVTVHAAVSLAWAPAAGAAPLSSAAPSPIALAAGANAFNPGTQSHEGACARETTRVAQAVHDYARNGVLSDFARLVGASAPAGALARTMDARLVVGSVAHAVVTANHGCDGAGDWFAVGPRTLTAGERAGIAVAPKLRRLLCLRSRRRCRRIVVEASTVFPVNCWNPNVGRVDVALYVHRRKRRPKRRVEPVREGGKPKSKPKRRSTPPTPAPLTPAPLPSTPAPVSRPAPTPTPTPTPIPTPTADPAASAAQLSCSEGASVVVTLSNGASATASATFVVDGANHGPIAAGGSEQVRIPVSSPGAKVVVTVTSSSKTLIARETFTNGCVAKPFAKATLVQGCVTTEPTGESLNEYEIELLNEAGATWPATFELEWTAGKGRVEAKEYGPLAAGESEKVEIDLGAQLSKTEPPELVSTIVVTSGARTIFSRGAGEVFFGC
ncbi:MAG: hypothetical protein ACYCUM_08525 [Solirubrobacteraceae bacterium]